MVQTIHSVEVLGRKDTMTDFPQSCRVEKMLRTTIYANLWNRQTIYLWVDCHQARRCDRQAHLALFRISWVGRDV